MIDNHFVKQNIVREIKYYNNIYEKCKNNFPIMAYRAMEKKNKLYELLYNPVKVVTETIV